MKLAFALISVNIHLYLDIKGFGLMESILISVSSVCT